MLYTLCLKKLLHFCFCNNLVECQPIFYNFWYTVTPEQISNNKRYVEVQTNRMLPMCLHYLDENELSNFNVSDN